LAVALCSLLVHLLHLLPGYVSCPFAYLFNYQSLKGLLRPPKEPYYALNLSPRRADADVI
jgi:hypothetical protein